MNDRLLELRAILADMRRRGRAARCCARGRSVRPPPPRSCWSASSRCGWSRGKACRWSSRRPRWSPSRSSRWCSRCCPCGNRRRDRQLARFIEEQAGGLDDVLVTAVEPREPGTGLETDSRAGCAARMPIRAGAVRLAVRAVDFDRVISASDLRSAAIGAAIGSVALLVAAVAFAPSANRAATGRGLVSVSDAVRHRRSRRVRSRCAPASR